MNYRHLGQAGIRVSELSLGSWITFKNQVDVDAAAEIMAAAYDLGVNFFDNAEAYANGQSEEVMGASLKKLGWRRGSYLVTTKIYWGLYQGVNEKNTLNRKRLIEGINGFRVEFGVDDLSETGGNVDYTAAVDWVDPDTRDSATNRGDGVPDDDFLHCTTAVPCTSTPSHHRSRQRWSCWHAR